MALYLLLLWICKVFTLVHSFAIMTVSLLCADREINSFASFSFVPEGEKLENKMKKLETQYNSLQVLSTITKLGTKEVQSSINVLFLTNEIVSR